MKREQRVVKERAAEGKNKPIAKDPIGERQQNAEIEPSRKAARETPGTDEAERKR